MLNDMTKLEWQKRLRGAHLTAVEYMVLSTLATYTDSTGCNAYPGWKRLSEDTYLDVKTVKRAVVRLCEKGFLRLSSIGGNAVGKGRANVYELTLSPPKGGQQDPPSELARGAEKSPRGAPESQGRGALVTPHQVLTSGPSHHSDTSYRGELPPAATGDHWDELKEDYDLFEHWLTEQGHEPDSTSLGMWESGVHPRAILNTLKKGTP